MSSQKWPAGAWSHTQFSELRRCPRAHKLKYEKGLRRKWDGASPKALEIGSYVHNVLEVVGLAVLSGSAASESVWRRAEVTARGKCNNPDALVEGARLIGAYRNRYGDEGAGWAGGGCSNDYHKFQLVGVEEVFIAKDLHAEIGGFASIADVVLRDESGKLVLGERKTAASRPRADDDEIVRGLKTRPQLLGLVYCARDHYGETPDLVYDVMTKTRMVDFMRLRVSFTDEELDKWAEEQKELEQLVPLSCPNRDSCDPVMGFRCQYFEFCHGTEEEKEKLYEIRLRK